MQVYFTVMLTRCKVSRKSSPRFALWRIIQRMSGYSLLRATVLRGGTAEVGLADWLIQRLDQPTQNQVPGGIPLRGFARVQRWRVLFYLLHTQSPRGTFRRS